MAIDKFNLPHMFFLSEIGHTDDVWQPRADVYRTREGWLVKLELAGVRPDEIRLNIEDHRLIVQGSRRDEHCRSGMGCHCLGDCLQPVSAGRGIARAFFRSGRDRDVLC